MIVVKKEYQNQGLGSMLLQYALKECAKKDMVSIRLEVAKNNKNAMNFYARKGFYIHSSSNRETYYLCRKI